MAQRNDPRPALYDAPPLPSYSDQIKSALLLRGLRSRGLVGLPRFVVDTKQGTLDRRVRFTLKDARLDLRAAWLAIAGALGMAESDIQKLALGEHVPLTSIRDVAPASSHDVDGDLLELLQLGKLRQRQEVASKPLDPMSWRRYFDIWTEAYLLVNADTPGHEERKEEAEEYADFIWGEMVRAHDPEVRQRIILYDDQVCQEILLPDGGRVRFLGEAKVYDVMYSTIVIHPNSAYSGIPSTRDRRQRSPPLANVPLRAAPTNHRYDSDSRVCGLWNDGIQCKPSCTREHVCSKCSSGGHPLVECPRCGSGRGSSDKRAKGAASGGGRKKGGAAVGGN